ncbi:MAG: hypothetical protein LBM75_11295 [Myxococcales bacterium]|jgi:hypothetical protein|nr:hypothetical protein [Myxococcales bacterium]
MKKNNLFLSALMASMLSLTLFACSSDDCEKCQPCQESDAGTCPNPSEDPGNDVMDAGNDVLELTDAEKAICEEISPSVLELLESALSDASEEFEIHPEDIYSVNKCETLLTNLSFCDEKTITLLNSLKGYLKNCAPDEKQCQEEADAKEAECDAIRTGCETARIECEANNSANEPDATDVNCFAEYTTCNSGYQPCMDQYYDKRDECDDTSSLCLRQYDIMQNALRASVCVEDNYTPESTLESFCEEQYQGCGQESATKCVDYFGGLLNNVTGEMAESGIPISQINRFENSVASLASCLLINLAEQEFPAGSTETAATCSDILSFVDAMTKENPEGLTEEQLQALIQKLISQAPNAIYACSDELLGVGASYADFVIQ